MVGILCDSSALRIVFCITMGYQCKHSLYTGICSQLHRQFLSDCLLYLRPEALMEKSLRIWRGTLMQLSATHGVAEPLSLDGHSPNLSAPIPVSPSPFRSTSYSYVSFSKEKSDNLFFSRFLTNIAKRFVL